MSAGMVLAGRYRLLDQVAVGAMGEVWRAHDDRLDRDVAVKVLRPELADDSAFLDRFRTEARHAASVRHPHVAAVHDYGEDERVLTGGTATAYLVMELLQGPTLGAVLETGGPLPQDRVARLLAQVADALAAAHRTGLVHRDVKPANLVVADRTERTDPTHVADGPDGTAAGQPGHEDVTVTDFGIARAADAVPITRTGLVMGTAEYLSPEQARGERASTASDIYSLGVVAYELLTGQPPFRGGGAAEVARAHVHDVPPALPASVSPAMRATVERCLLKDPSRRPRAAELAARLRALAEGTATEDGWTAPEPAEDPGPQAAGGPSVTPPQASPAGWALPGGPRPVRATRPIPVTPARRPGRTPGSAPEAPRRRRRRSPLRAPVAALLALLALLLLATALQQAGVLGDEGDGSAARAVVAGPPAAPDVTGSPWTTNHEDGR